MSLISIEQTSFWIGAIGKNLYAYLHALYEPKILESFIPLEKVLEEKYIALNSYNRISQYDFIHTLRLGRTFFASTELVFYDEDWYDRVEAIIHSGNSGITNYFHKAGITAIHSFQSDSVCLISSQDVCKDVWFEQYLENDYLLLQKTLETDNNASRKIYYYHLLANTTIDMNQLIDQMYLELSPSDYVSVLLSKMRERLAKLSIFDRQETLTREIEHLFATAPEKYRNSIGYLKMLFESSSKLILEMQSLLEKQEKRNKYGRNGWESGHAFTHIWKLQAMAYDYYFFFKCNYLPLDYFSDVNSFLCYYLQAILCSYTPVATEESDSVFGITTDHKRYPLNDIDLDMITKYVDTKTLKDWMKKYYVHSIEVLDSGTAIVSKYNHLCESFVHIGNAKWVSCIMNFTIIISISEIDDLVKIKAFDTFIFNYEKASKCSVKKCELLFETLYFLLNSNETYLSGEFKKQAIAVLLKDDVYRTIIEHNSYKLGRILRNYASFLDDENRRRQITYIGKQQELKTKIKEIYNRRFLLPKEEFRPILIENVCLLNIEELFNLLVEKYIPFSKIIQDIFVNAIKIEDEKRKTMPGVRTFPDHLIATIDDCIILKLCNIDFDVSLLVPYAEYSLPLQFMLDPEQFDYSQINTDHYMWQNLIYSKEYKRHFLKHKKEILSPKLNEIFKMGLSTVEQQKIVYGVLLGDDELRDY